MLTYVDWSEGKANPEILDETEIGHLRESEKTLARKFESVSEGIKELCKDENSG